MRFDVPVPCFFGNIDFCEAIKKVSALGFDAVETYDWKSLALDKVKNTCDETGVELLSLCTSCFELTDKNYRNEWLCGLKESCAAAKKLGAKMLITQVGADTGEDRKYQHENIVTTLINAKPILEEYGITVIIEPLNVLFDHKGYYLPTSKEAFDIIKEVSSPFVKVVYDIYHQQISEGNIIPTIRENIEHIAHFHCAGHPGRHELQYGESDYKNIFSAIDELNYKGSCGLEYNPLLPAEESLNSFREIYISKIKEILP